MNTYTATAIAHISDDARVQSMSEHQEGVAKLCSNFLTNALGEEWHSFGELLGAIHDLGKYNPDWQNYLLRSRGLIEGTPLSTPHSASGALYANKRLPQRLGRIASFCIASHHRGLYDYSDLSSRIESDNEKLIYEKSTAQKQLFHEAPTWSLQLETGLKELLKSKEGRSDIQMLIRMIFSCLVDADARDTELFMAPNIAQQRERFQTLYQNQIWCSLREKLYAHTEQFVADSEINRARSLFLSQCKRHGETAPKGIYSLFLPTGGGKTLSSMAWALETAERHHLERIIVVLPFTSIITQTCQILRNIFGADAILEHHSDIDTKRIETEQSSSSQEGESSWLKLLADNWQDVPIIVTTNVQFFESLFANRPSKCRKVHSIANSVLLFDECQAFPTEQLSPMLRSIESLSRCCGTQTLLCTATQPVFDESIKSLNRTAGLYNIKTPIEEVVPYDATLFAHFERVKYHLDIKNYSIKELALELSQYSSALCIVNSRKEACLLYEALRDIRGTSGDGLIHLSRMMCSEHLGKQIAQIRHRVSSKLPTIVISTQLIEAGVDLDFPIVYRAYSGLDSIIQAAGRCNREGRLSSKGNVYIFKLTDVNTSFPALSKSQYATEEVLAGQNVDLHDPEISKEYYRKLYGRHKDFDKGNMLQHLWNIKVTQDIKLNFESAQKAFRLIDNEGNFDLFVPYTEAGEKIINKIMNHHWLERDELRSLQRLRVGLRKKDLEELFKQGSISIVHFFGEEKNPILILTDKRSYSDELGVTMTNYYLEEPQLV